MLARLFAALRHRAHLPLPQEHNGLDHAVTVQARAGRPLELADGRHLHPTPSWSWSRRRSPPAMGTTSRTDHAHSGTCAKGVSATSCSNRHTGQSTETFTGRTGTAERDPKTPKNPLSGGQKGCVSRRPGFNRKLSPLPLRVRPAGMLRRAWHWQGGSPARSPGQGAMRPR